MSKAQLDMFAAQADLFPAQPASYVPNPDRVRGKLAAVLAELCAADEMPWHRRQQRFHQTVSPQMINWLPDEEARQMLLEFEAHMDRLSQAS